HHRTRRTSLEPVGSARSSLAGACDRCGEAGTDGPSGSRGWQGENARVAEPASDVSPNTADGNTPRGGTESDIDGSTEQFALLDTDVAARRTRARLCGDT